MLDKIEVHTHGIGDAQRPEAEELFRATVLLGLQSPLDVTFQHIDSLTAGEVGVSVPKLNGELKVPTDVFLLMLGQTLCSLAEEKVVEAKMRGTCNAWRRTPGRSSH